MTKRFTDWSSVRSEDRLYLGLALVTMISVVRFVAERNWGGDYWEHAAAAAELARHPFSPLNPYTGTEGSSILLDPWHLIVGTASRTGLGVETTIAFVAVVQLIAVLIAIRAFARGLVTWQWAGPCFLVATFLFWGYQPWRWSGFLDLNGLGFVISYPSTGATAAMLFGIVSLNRWVTHDGSRRDLWVLIGCAFVVGASIPMTLIPATTLAAAVAASRPTRLRWHRVAALRGWEQQPSSGS